MTVQEAENVELYKKSKRFGYCDFEVDPVDNTLKGWIRASIHEGGRPEGDQDPVDIISTGEEIWVHVKWRIWGHLAHHLCGYFCVCVNFESIGPGPEFTVQCEGTNEPCQIIPMDPCGDGYYDLWCRIPAGQVKAAHCGSVYLVAVTLTSLNACKKPGHIAAFCNDLSVMVYDPEKCEEIQV
jgi:hypothetical protein